MMKDDDVVALADRLGKTLDLLVILVRVACVGLDADKGSRA